MKKINEALSQENINFILKNLKNGEKIIYYDDSDDIISELMYFIAGKMDYEGYPDEAGQKAEQIMDDINAYYDQMRK